MPFMYLFPSTNFHDLNLDWILQRVKELEVTSSPEAIEEMQQRIEALETEWDDLDTTVNALIRDYMDNEYVFPLATRTSVGGVIVGNGLDINTTIGDPDEGTISLKPATMSTLGGIKAGTGLEINTSIGDPALGTLSLHTATQYLIGGVKVGAYINIASDGTISLENNNLPLASYADTGAVKIGVGLLIDNAGTVSVDYSQLPRMSANTFGVAKVGTGLAVDADGRIYATGQSVAVVPPATYQTIGGVIVGTGLSVITNQSDPYVGKVDLKPATDAALGGVITGIKENTHIDVDANGIISTYGLADSGSVSTLSNALGDLEDKAVTNSTVGGEFNTLFDTRFGTNFKTAFNARFSLSGTTLTITPVP